MKIKSPLINILVSLFLPWLILNPISYSGFWIFSNHYDHILHHKWWFAMGLFLGYHLLIGSSQKSKVKILWGLGIGGILGIIWNISGVIFPIWILGISTLYLILVHWTLDIKANQIFKTTIWLGISFVISGFLYPFSAYLSFAAFFLIQNVMLIYLPQNSKKYHLSQNNFNQNLNTARQIIEQVKFN